MCLHKNYLIPLSAYDVTTWNPQTSQFLNRFFSFICTSHHLKQGSTIHINDASAVLYITLVPVDSNAIEAVLHLWLYKHCHCPNSWKRQNWAGKEKEQAPRARQYSKAEATLPTKQASQHWKSFGRYQSKLSSCYQPILSFMSVVQVLSFFYVIVKIISENSSYNFRKFNCDFSPAIRSELSNRVSQPNAQHLQYPLATFHRIHSPDNRLMNILGKHGVEILPNN